MHHWRFFGWLVWDSAWQCLQPESRRLHSPQYFGRYTGHKKYSKYCESSFRVKWMGAWYECKLARHHSMKEHSSLKCETFGDPGLLVLLSEVAYTTLMVPETATVGEIRKPWPMMEPPRQNIEAQSLHVFPHSKLCFHELVAKVCKHTCRRPGQPEARQACLFTLHSSTTTSARGCIIFVVEPPRQF